PLWMCTAHFVDMKKEMQLQPLNLMHCFDALPLLPTADIHYGSAVTVTQTPSFVNGSTGTEISFRCSVDEANYKLFWYQQLPGKTELKVLGNFYSEMAWQRDRVGAGSNKMQKRVTRAPLLKFLTNFLRRLGRRVGNGWGGGYARHVWGGGGLGLMGTGVQPRPSVILLSPVCHKKRITLVCLAQGFHYEWPLDVIWERDGQKITRLSSATEPVRKEGECNFATASRLSVLAEEWQKGHNYSCHVNQTGQVVGDSVEGIPDYKTGKEMLGNLSKQQGDE
uniref:Ig-like domain-containing protein n=1 Tax=Naja naja TaxID=35670 RepID=A0A8C6X129_NAJNA